MTKVDFDLPNWEEALLISALTQIEQRFLEKKFPTEKLLLDMLGCLDTYLENIAIREPAPVFHDASDKLSELLLYARLDMENKKPLNTLEKSELYASFIDLLVFFGSEKTKAIDALADWLGLSPDKLKKDAKFCRIKVIGGKVQKNAPATEKGLLLKNYRHLISLIEENEKKGREFPQGNSETFNAFLKVKEAVYEVSKICPS